MASDLFTVKSTIHGDDMNTAMIKRLGLGLGIAGMGCLTVASQAVEPLSPVQAYAASYKLEAKGQLDSALNVLADQLAHNPADEYVLLRAGWLNYRLGHFQASEVDYRNSLTLNPQSLDARMGVTLPLMAEGRWRESLLYAQQVQQMAPGNYDASIRVLLCEQMLKNWSGLRAQAINMTHEFPAESDPWLYLARAASALGDNKASRKAYGQVLFRVPEQAEAVHALLP